MSVKITEDMHDTFIKNGFTEDDISNTVNHYRQQGQSDDEIYNNLNNKYQSLLNNKTSNNINNTQKEDININNTQINSNQEETENSSQILQGGVKKYNTNPHPIKRGIVQTGRNIARFLLPKKAENWFIGSKEDEDFLKKYNENNVPTYEELKEDYDAGYINKDEFTNGIKLRGKLNELTADREYRNERNKNIGIGTLSIGTAFIPAFGVAKGAALAQKGLQAVGQATKLGALNGAIGGGIYGLGESLIDEDKNVVKNTLSNAGLGGVLGGILGGAGNAVSQGVKRKLAQKVSEKTVKNDQNTVKTELNNLIENISNEKNPTISKSIDPKNISKKNLAAEKREFKNNIESLKSEKLPKTTIRMRYKNRYWSKNIDDPYTIATQEADDEFNKILSEIKKDPSSVNDPKKIADFEARLESKTNSLDEEHAAEYWNKYWQAFEEGSNFEQTNSNYNALANRQQKTRGAVETVAKKINSEVADAITDNKYYTRGYDVNKAQLEKMSPYEIENLINSDDISDLSITARAMDINNDLNSGKIPLWKLNKWAADGTPIGQAMQARSLLKMDTPEGAIQVLAGTIRKATPKKVNDIIDNVPNLINASENGEAALDSALKRVNKRERKYLIDRIMDLKSKDELTPDNLVKVINKKYNVPEITPDDFENVKKLTSDIQNATDERSSEVAKGLLRKYIGDKIPRKFMDKVNTYRYTNMLLSPKSRVKDFLFTGLFQADQALDELIANGISKGITQPLKGINSRSGLHFGEWAKGLKKGLSEGAEDVKLGITTGRAGEGSRFDLPKSAQFRYKPLNEVEGLKKIPQFFENIMSGAEKGLNYTIRVPDRMFYEGRYASSIADQMKAAGVTQPTDEMIEQAVKEARDAVYQGDTWASRTSLGARDFLNKLPTGNFKIGDWTMPFVQTVANITEEGLKNTGGLPVGAYKLLKADTPELIRDAEILTAKGIKGLGLGALGYNIGKGNIESNIGDKDNYANEITGMQPQSIVVGDKSFSLSNAPNLSIPIAIGRAFGEKGFNREGGMQALLNAGTAVGDMPALKAIGDINNIVSNSYGQSLEPAEILDNIVRNQGINYATQMIPFSGLQRNIRNVIDPYGRELYTENTPQYISNRLLNGLPFASETLPLKYNALGEPVKVNNIQNPILRGVSEAIDLGVRNYNNDKTNNELNELSERMKDTDVRGKTQVALKKSKRTVRANGENVKLDNEKYSNFQREYGRINYLLRKRALDNPEFAQLSDSEKTEYLMELRQSVEEAVKIMQFNHEPTRKLKPYTQEILDNYDSYFNKE